MLTPVKKKENIRYEVRHPGFRFPWFPLLLSFLFLLLMSGIHPVIITFLMALWLQSSVFRNHIIIVVHDDLQHG